MVKIARGKINTVMKTEKQSASIECNWREVRINVDSLGAVRLLQLTHNRMKYERNRDLV